VKVVWTKQALRDLEAIHAYIALDSPYYAAGVVETLLGAEEQIAEHPTAGGLVREKISHDLRQVKRYSYRIIYRILPSGREIHILTVCHGKRNLQADDF
jgi:addiction module RelE/StbE family toxin